MRLKGFYFSLLLASVIAWADTTWDRRPPLPECWDQTEHWRYQIDRSPDGADACVLQRHFRVEPVGITTVGAPNCAIPFQLTVVVGGRDQCKLP